MSEPLSAKPTMNIAEFFAWLGSTQANAELAEKVKEMGRVESENIALEKGKSNG